MISIPVSTAAEKREADTVRRASYQHDPRDTLGKRRINSLYILEQDA